MHKNKQTKREHTHTHTHNYNNLTVKGIFIVDIVNSNMGNYISYFYIQLAWIA